MVAQLAQLSMVSALFALVAPKTHRAQGLLPVDSENHLGQGSAIAQLAALVLAFFLLVLIIFLQVCFWTAPRRSVSYLFFLQPMFSRALIICGLSRFLPVCGLSLYCSYRNR